MYIQSTLSVKVSSKIYVRSQFYIWFWKTPSYTHLHKYKKDKEESPIEFEE